MFGRLQNEVELEHFQDSLDTSRSYFQRDNGERYQLKKIQNAVAAVVAVDCCLMKRKKMTVFQTQHFP